MTHILSFDGRGARLALFMPYGGLEDFMRNVNLVRLEDACRHTLEIAHDLIVKYGWGEFKAYGHAEDLLQGMSNTLIALQLYKELSIVIYYDEIVRNRMNKALNAL